MRLGKAIELMTGYLADAPASSTGALNRAEADDMTALRMMLGAGQRIFDMRHLIGRVSIWDDLPGECKEVMPIRKERDVVSQNR